MPMNFLAEATAMPRDAWEKPGDERDYNKLLETLKTNCMTPRWLSGLALKMSGRRRDVFDRRRPAAGNSESNEDAAARK